MAAFYPWLKAAHVISVIAWMAGLLYLPRLFVYHCEAPVGSAQSETFKVMERRLLVAIMTPAMAASFLFGAALLAVPGVADWRSGWLWGKLGLAGGLALVHGLLAGWRRDFAADRNVRPQRFYRLINEVPTVLMVAIVILVIVKPF
jgi:putative membrane protein